MPFKRQLCLLGSNTQHNLSTAELMCFLLQILFHLLVTPNEELKIQSHSQLKLKAMVY